MSRDWDLKALICCKWCRQTTIISGEKCCKGQVWSSKTQDVEGDPKGEKTNPKSKGRKGKIRESQWVDLAQILPSRAWLVPVTCRKDQKFDKIVFNTIDRNWEAKNSCRKPWNFLRLQSPNNIVITLVDSPFVDEKCNYKPSGVAIC